MDEIKRKLADLEKEIALKDLNEPNDATKRENEEFSKKIAHLENQNTVKDRVSEELSKRITHLENQYTEKERVADAEGYARLKSSAQIALIFASIGSHAVQLNSWYLDGMLDNSYGVYLIGITSVSIIMHFFTGGLIFFVAKMSPKEKEGKRLKKLPADAPKDEPTDALSRNTVKANFIATLLLYAISFLDVMISGTRLGSSETLPNVGSSTAAPI